MSEQRKYSIEEIDAMRAAIRSTIGYTDRNSYRESERAAQVEDMLRTHMLNGTSVEELKAAEKRAKDTYFERQQAEQEYYREVQRQHSEKFPERPRPDGILEGLRVKDQRTDAFGSGGFRCGSCQAMQPGDAFIVWVPDGVRMGERAASITNAVEANKFNGHHSGWCVDCARRLTRKAGA